MSLAGFSVKNAVLVNILMIAIIVIGTISFIRLPRELLSSVSLNWAMVIAPYPGASPKEVEQLVTIPIEDDIKDIKGIDFIFSKSAEGYAAIDVKFEDMPEEEFRYALQELKNRVGSIDDLPEDVERIEVQEINTGDLIPVINITISGMISERMLRQIADNLEDEIKQIRNVSKVEKMGMSDREIWVEVDPQRLYNFGLTLPQTIQALVGKNLNMPGGKLTSGRSEFLLRTVGKIESAQELKKVILRQTPGGRTVSVDDVAEVREIFNSEMGTISRMDGRQAITLSITKKSEGNSLIVINEIKKIVRATGEKLHAEVRLEKKTGPSRQSKLESRASNADVTISLSELPEPVAKESRDHFLKLTATSDSSIEIRETLATLENNALVGLGLVLILLYFFLGWRYAFMAALGMIISFLGAFIFMSYIGSSFNSQSLFGLVLVMGIVVDDAIIILENCFRYLQRGYKPRKAAVLGTDEVFAPVVSATLTTVSAFMPLMLLPGIMGSFLRMIPLVVSLALIGSMIEAFIILPTHVAEWSGYGVPTKKNRIIDLLNQYYPQVLRNFLHFRYLIVGVGLLVCILSAFLIPSLGIDLYSGKKLPRFSLFVEMPIGTSLAVTDETIRRIEAEALALPGDDVESVIAVSGLIQADDWIVSSHVGQVIIDIKAKDQRTLTCDELMNQLRRRVSHISGPRIVRFKRQTSGPPVGKPVEIKVKGKDLDRLRMLSGQVQAELRKIPGVYDIGDDFNPGKQEIRILVDENKAALFGLSVAQVAQTVQAAFLGGEASIWRDKDEEVKIYVKLAKRWRCNPDDLRRLQIGTPSGVQVPLAKIASLEIEQGYSEIKHFKAERSITVFASIDVRKTTAVEVNAAIDANSRNILSPFPGYSIDFEGEFKQFTQAFDNLKQFFTVGVALIYLILSGQFRSFVQPLIILFTIPFAFLGAMVGLVVMGTNFTVLTMYGIVALAGIAVNDAIVLISFINNARARGTGKYASLIEGGVLRMRPILLTSVTTICGLMPMAIGLGGHSESWAPLANTIIWGMIFATFLTLLVIPAVYTIIVDDIATPIRRMIRFLTNLPKIQDPPEYTG